MGKKKRERVERTDDWDELLPLFGWPEQERYEEIRPRVIFCCLARKMELNSSRLP